MKIIVGSVCDGSDAYINIWKPCIDSHKNYCEHHGYEYQCERILDKSRPPSWSKILVALKYIDQCDYFVWLDADTLITNNQITIEYFIDLMDGKDMLIACDLNGLNCGTFMVRKCEFIVNLFEKIYSLKSITHNGWWEQTAFMLLYHNNQCVRDRVCVLTENSSTLFNARHYNWCEQNSLLIHFPGLNKIYYNDYFKSKANKSNDLTLSNIELHQDNFESSLYNKCLMKINKKVFGFELKESYTFYNRN